MIAFKNQTPGGGTRALSPKTDGIGRKSNRYTHNTPNDSPRQVAPETTRRFVVNTRREAPPGARAAWLRIVAEIELTRPMFASQHRLRTDGQARIAPDGALEVVLPPCTAAWMKRFQTAGAAPLELACRGAGWEKPVRFFSKDGEVC